MSCHLASGQSQPWRRFPNGLIPCLWRPKCVPLLARCGGIPQCQTKCFEVGRALPSLFHVADRGIQFPTQAPVKVADSYRR